MIVGLRRLVRFALWAFKRRKAARQAAGTILNVLHPVPPAPPRAANDNVQDSELVRLRAQAAELQARAASGTAGCIVARRQLRDVRHAILRRELALCGPVRTTA